MNRIYLLCTLFVCISLFSCRRSSTPSQLLDVCYLEGSTAVATLVVNGETLFVDTAFVGRNGMGKTAEGDGKTPLGTLHPLFSFGVLPHPDDARRMMPYVRVTPSTFACDEDCRYYNTVVDTAEVHHDCHGEDMYHLVPAYNYGLATDYNRECDPSRGSNIFVHCKGDNPFTAGCVALSEECMRSIIIHCDTTLSIHLHLKEK